MHTKTIQQLSDLLQTRQISAVELAKLFLGRIADSGLNAFLHVDPELTLQQAAAADQLLAQKQATPLTGIPIAHKDMFVTRGWRSTAGSKMLENYVSPFDATVVERFQQAGMVTLGKLNCDEFAMGSTNENSFFGAVKNPWDTDGDPGRIVRRLGGGGGGAPDAGRDRHRHRRLDPAAGRALRRHRHQADLRQRVALRHDRLRLLARPGRPDRQERRRLRAAAERDGRLRRARLDQRRAPPGRRRRRLHARR